MNVAYGAGGVNFYPLTRNVFLRGAPVEATDGGLAPLAEHSIWKLIEAFGKILERTGKKITHDVTVDHQSIGDRVNQLADRLEAKARREGVSGAARAKAIWESEHWPLEALDRLRGLREDVSPRLLVILGASGAGTVA